MKKRTLSLFLALALSMGLAAPALAEGDITSTSLRIDGAEYPLDAAASGTGWSYDGNYTVTLSGYSDPEGAINFNNPDRQVNLSLASGTTSDANFYLMFAYGSRRAQALNVTGSGTLNTAGLNNNTLIVSGGTVNADYVSATDSFTMNGGTIYAPILTVNADDTTLNGGSIVLDRSSAIAEAEKNNLMKYWEDDDYSVLELHASGLEAASAVAAQFRGADGQPLTAKEDANPNTEDRYYAYNADGTPAQYATFGSGAAQPSTPAQPADTAYATSYSIVVDGEAVAFDAYALKDAAGNDTNYLKLRDVAHVLNGSQAQFSVGWDGSIALTTGAAYEDTGSEMATPFSGNRAYQTSRSAVTVDGKSVDLDAILLTDDAGNGYTYFKLRDLGAALGFNVTWDAAASSIVIDTTQPYQA